MITFLLGFILGIFALIGYGAYRALGSDGWDDSNLLNWLRLLSHVYIHPEDFSKMYYLEAMIPGDEVETVRDIARVQSPFPYLGKDEFGDNFPGSRP